MKTVSTMRVSQLMNRDVKTCSSRDGLSRAAQLMWDNDCGFVPVVEFTEDGHRRVVGVITDRDVCMATYTKGLAPASIQVGEVMSRGVRTCRSEDTPETAELLMRQHRIRRLPVVDSMEDLVGVLSLTDLVRWGARERWPAAPHSPLEGVTSTLAALCEPWRAIHAGPPAPAQPNLTAAQPKPTAAQPKPTVAQPKNGAPPDRRNTSTAEQALARRQGSDEQC